MNAGGAAVGLLDQIAAGTKSVFGTMARPVRASANLLLNDPDGWVANQGAPWPWSAKVDWLTAEDLAPPISTT